MIRRFFAFAAAVTMILSLAGCGGDAAPASPASSGSGAPPESPASQPAPAAEPVPAVETAPWEDFPDMMGNPVTLEGGRVTSLSTSRACLWVPGEEGYLTLTKANRDLPLGNYAVNPVSTSYTLQYPPEGGAVPAFDSGCYQVTSEQPVPGLLQIAPEEIAFFPYPSEGFRLWMVSPRTEEEERDRLADGVLPLAEGGELRVQPLGVVLTERAAQTALDSLPPSEGEAVRWYDAQLVVDDYFRSITVYSGRAEDGSLSRTRAWVSDCGVTIGDPVNLAGPVEFSDAPLEEPAFPPAFSWTELRDVAGEPLKMTRNSSGNWLTVDYAVGWDPMGEGYFSLEQGRQVGNYTVSGPYSYYCADQIHSSSHRMICYCAGCTLTCRDPIPGLLQVDEEEGTAFFPYQQEGFQIPLLHYRNRDREEQQAHGAALLPELGGERNTQALRIWLDEEDAEKIAALLPPGQGDGPRWFDASLCFGSLEVQGLSGGWGESSYVTRVIAGELDAGASAVGQEIYLTGKLEIYNRF